MNKFEIATKFVEESRPTIDVPLRIALEDGTFALVGTNGHMAMIFSGLTHADVSEAEPAPDNIAQVIRSYLAEPAPRQMVDTKTLRDWSGSPGFATCDLCKGSVKYEHECPDCGLPHMVECEQCDGGKVWPKPRYGRVDGFVYNRWYIARALEDVRDPAVCVGTAAAVGALHADGIKALLIAGDGWRAVILGCRNTTDETRSAPVLAVERAAVSP